jgi:hypothetical protein
MSRLHYVDADPDAEGEKRGCAPCAPGGPGDLPSRLLGVHL